MLDNMFVYVQHIENYCSGIFYFFGYIIHSVQELIFNSEINIFMLIIPVTFLSTEIWYENFLRVYSGFIKIINFLEETV